MNLKPTYTLKQFLTRDQKQVLELIAKQPQFWQQLQLALINQKLTVTCDQLITHALKAKLLQKESVNFHEQCAIAFKSYATIEQMSLTDQNVFYYWFAGLMDGDGHMRCTSNNKELVITMGSEDLMLLHWIKCLIGGRVVSVANKNAYRLIFNQSNCDLKLLIANLNGKINVNTKTLVMEQFCNIFNLIVKPSKLSSVNTVAFNAYVRGLFDADGSVYIKPARQTIQLTTINSDEHWLSNRITANSLRIYLCISGQAQLMQLIKPAYLTLTTSTNKPKQDGSPSITCNIKVSCSGPLANNVDFASFLKCLTHFNLPVPSVKQLRLQLTQEFFDLQRPLMTQNNVVHSSCVNLLLAWLIFPIAHKERFFKLSLIKK